MPLLTDARKLLRAVDLSGGKTRPIEDLNVLFVGAGAIGASVAAWLGEHRPNVFVYDRKPILDAIQKQGITAYASDDRENRKTIRVQTIAKLSDLVRPDVVVVSVKNYHLDGVAKEIKKQYGDDPYIIAMQNGVENQKILPKYFTKVIYCVICYNAWVDEPGVVGYQKKGPLVFGTAFNELPAETSAIAEYFNAGVDTIHSRDIHDAALSKLVVNLTNSLTTLIGHGFKEITDRPLYQKLLTNITWEGAQIVRAAGYKECRLGGMPSWLLFRLGATLPPPVTRPLFEKNLKKMVMSSMTQDIIQRGGSDSELESINGHILSLADQHGIRAPYNRAIYGLCKKEFAKSKFTPLEIKDVWKAVEMLIE